MISGNCVSNTAKGGLSPCGRVCCKFILFRLQTTFSSYFSLDVMLSQSAVSRFRSPVMTIVDSCSAAVLYSSFRKALRSLLLALYGLFFGGLYMQQGIVGFGFVGSSTAASSMSFSFGSDQMFTLLCGRSLIAMSTPSCFVLWLHDCLSFLWISYPRRKRASSGMSLVSQVSVRRRMSYNKSAISLSKANLLKSKSFLTLQISVLIFGFVFSSQSNSSDDCFCFDSSLLSMKIHLLSISLM